ncbi:PREDICTED: protein IQ-DOMAIN 14-like [Camelina sativa]|uniref:Protein IQ-DOMAIN 14-like n=1 Tax=Camelina sativa TaxID=90675 RepID=A0ABM1RQB1_CAMSA|nr:PREDICTED: protein IQ-DOMAIN 14-like [Camelina sativa]XP_019101199.1 PREDICTED: protein IQ-DOMAIN 14-like [Camelina sativa]
MVKKGSWFSAIKRVFTPHSKEKLGNETEIKSGKEKRKKGFGKREPSSIEKILGEAARDHNLVFRPPTPDRPNPFSVSPPPPLRPASPRVPSPRPTSPRVASPRAAAPKPPSPRAEVPRSLSPKPSSSSSRADLPRSLSPKPSDRSKPASASANAPPLRPASTRVPSQRITPPSVPSPRTSSPRGASPQAVSSKSPSPRVEPPPTLDTPRPPSPKPPSPRADPPRLDVPRPTTPRPPSPRAEAPRFDAPRPTTPKPPSPRAEPPRLEAPRPTTPKPPSPRADPPRLDAPRPTTPKLPSPRAVSPRAVQRREIVYRPEPTLSVQHASATKIQGAFRGFMARKSFRALKGLVRLQGVVRGYSVKRQTINAMKYMQQVVRVQSQIQSRRIKVLENKAQVEKDEAKWAATEAGNDNWDDSVLTKEERDARSLRKTEAIIKRERSMAYAYSRKLWKNSPKSTQENRSSGGFPQWWNWADRQNPLASPAPSYSQPVRDFRLTPSRLCPSPLSQSSKKHHTRLDNHFDSSTPRSSRSTLLTPSRHTGTSRYSRGRLIRGQDSPFKDDDSLTSCPPFPSYMAPTVSAKAKVRPNSNPKERVMGTPVSEKRRMSYPPTQQQGLDTFRWNKGSLVMSNSSSQRSPGSPGGVVLEKHKTLKSVGNLSIGSSASTVGRKEFNRFV